MNRTTQTRSKVKIELSDELSQFLNHCTRHSKQMIESSISTLRSCFEHNHVDGVIDVDIIFDPIDKYYLSLTWTGKKSCLEGRLFPFSELNPPYSQTMDEQRCSAFLDIVIEYEAN